MATFYQGPRPVLKGRNDKQNINPYRNKLEVYSNWSIYNPSHIFDGAPDVNHIMGTGYSPGDVYMTRTFLGKHNGLQPLKNAGLGARQAGARYGPWLSRAAGNNKVFKAVYGHLPGTPVAPSGQIYWYSNLKYRGVKPIFSSTYGHAIRRYGVAGVPNSFGYFVPVYPDATRKNPLTKPYGQVVPLGYANPYGHNRVNEWHGAAASKALK